MDKTQTIPGYGMRYTITKSGTIMDLISNTEVTKRVDSSGYYVANLYTETGFNDRKRVHLLLLITFKLDSKPRCSKLQGFFKDGNRTNLHINNIEWGHYATYQAEQKLIEEANKKLKPVYQHYCGILVATHANITEAIERNDGVLELDEETLLDVLDNGNSIGRHVFSFEDLTPKYKAAASKMMKRLSEKTLNFNE